MENRNADPEFQISNLPPQLLAQTASVRPQYALNGFEEAGARN